VTQNLAVTEAARRRLFFQHEVEQEKVELALAEENLRRTQESTGLIELDSQAKAIIEGVARLRGEIAAKEVERQAMSSFATDQNPDYKLTQQQLEGLRAQLARMERSERLGNGNIDVPTQKVPQAGLEYLRSLRDVKYHEMLFEVLAKQFEAAKIDEAKEGSIIQVIDYAVPPDKKSGPHRSIILLLGIVVGLTFSSAWIFLTEMSRDPDQQHHWMVRIVKSYPSWRA
jgi:tyrosine-protein kinase Etk/Wzc